MELNIEVSEKGKVILKNKMRILKLHEAVLKTISIPGFDSSQIRRICSEKFTEYRHLGMDFKIKVEGE